jgi:8-oxoguanine deaminase
MPLGVSSLLSNLPLLQDVFVSAKIAMAELLLAGITTSSDHLYVYPNDVTLDDTIRAAKEIGIRFHPVRGIMSKGKSSGGIAPDSLVEDEDAALLDAKRLIDQYHDNSRHSMLRMALGPCSQMVVTIDLMKKAAKLARSYEGVRLHTHLAENQEDIDYNVKTWGTRFKEYMEATDWNQGDCWYAHCCCLDEEEQKMLAKAGMGVAQCPSSNLRLASGIAPIRAMLDRGVNVGLGVDGMASNDNTCMLSEARLAMFLQRSGGDPKAMSCREALLLATRGGAFNLGRDDIGQIAPGFSADLAAWRTDTLGFTGTGSDPIAALILCATKAGNADLVICNGRVHGRVVVKGGELQTVVDLPGLISDHNTRSSRICSLCEDLKDD